MNLYAIIIMLNVALASSDNETSCVDRDENCFIMAKEGLCKKNLTIMRETCAKTCRFCKSSNEYDSVAISDEENVYTIQKNNDENNIDETIQKEKTLDNATEEKPTSPAKCEDSKNAKCSKGDCLLHAQKMFTSCPKSCGVCELSTDELLQLLEDAKFGVPQLIGPSGVEGINAIIATINAGYKEADNSLCRNKDPHCAFWASRGYCETNYMKENCRPVCQFCS